MRESTPLSVTLYRSDIEAAKAVAAHMESLPSWQRPGSPTISEVLRYTLRVFDPAKLGKKRCEAAIIGLKSPGGGRGGKIGLKSPGGGKAAPRPS